MFSRNCWVYNYFRHFKTPREYRQCKYIPLRVWGCHSPYNYWKQLICIIFKVILENRPNTLLEICVAPLLKWSNYTFSWQERNIQFCCSIFWTEPQRHANEYYFCLRNINRSIASSNNKIQYRNLHSAMILVLYSNELPVSYTPSAWRFYSFIIWEGKLLWSCSSLKTIYLFIMDQNAVSHIRSLWETWMI